MKGPRLTIGGLGLAVALSALLLAAWRAHDPLPAFLVLLAVVLALMLGVVEAIVATGRARRFWCGFALAGLAYLGASYLLPSMPTDDWIFAFVRLTTPDADDPFRNGFWDPTDWEHSAPSSRFFLFSIMGPNRSPVMRMGPFEYYHEVFSIHRSLGHSVLTIAAASVAGLLGLAWPRRQRARPTTEPRP